MSGQWPPEWDDLDDVPGEADQQDTEAEARLSEVSAYLASVPAPVMPGSVEARISAALAVESAARSGVIPASGGAERDDPAQAEGGAQAESSAQAESTAQADGTAQADRASGARVLGPAPARARVRRRGARVRRGTRDTRKALGQFVLAPLAVCLLIVIIALGLSHVGSSSSSSSANSVAGAPAAGSTFASAASSAPASSAAGSAALPEPAATAAPSSGGFVVTESGTGYQRATLAQQAQAQVLAAQAREGGPVALPSAAASSPAASASSSSAFTLAPDAVLRGCVLTVTGGVPPKLVDRATYQGTPAYIIASSSRVWVVGLGCTAARPEVIASVPLAG